MSGKSIVTVFISLCVASLFFLWCSGQTEEMAGGVETTNGITVVASDGEIKGMTVPGTQIIITDTSYEPLLISDSAFADTVYAGDKGDFILHALPAGVYNIVARKSDFSGGCIIRNIEADSSSIGPYEDSSFFMPLGVIEVLVKLDTVPQQNSKVFIRGTTILAITTADGIGRLTGIPDGIYKIEAVYKSARVINPKLYAAYSDNVQVGTADTIGTITLDLHLQE